MRASPRAEGARMLDAFRPATLKLNRDDELNVTPERKVLLIDGLVGAGALLNGALSFSLSVQRWVVFVLVGAALWITGIYYWVDRTAIEESLRNVLVGSLGIAGPFLVGLTMALLDYPLAPTVVAGVMTGYGLGILGYRVVYGLVRPIPDCRLERMRGRAV
jgi:hypothetical protein